MFTLYCQSEYALKDDRMELQSYESDSLDITVYDSSSDNSEVGAVINFNTEQATKLAIELQKWVAKQEKVKPKKVLYKGTI